MTRVLLLSLIVASSTLAQDVVVATDSSTSDMSIMTLMVSQITPASDTLWGVEDPQSDAEWQVFENAAADLIKMFDQARKGGSGENDIEWSNDAAWQKYIDEEVAALNAATIAVKSRDLEMLWAANDALYTPCEACHIDFNPAVDGENR